MKKYTIALIQMAMSADVADNFAKATSFIEKAAKQGAHVISLPELFVSQYFCQKEDSRLFDLAENFDSSYLSKLKETAAKLNIVLVAPYFERRAAGVYHNSAAVIDSDGKNLGIYRKMHIPDDPSYYEKYYFTPGDLGYKKFSSKYADLSVLICWDQWYPEGARISSLMGSSVLFYPTAIGWHPKEREQYGVRQCDAWMTVQRGHAIANGIYVAAANRVGHEAPAGGDGILFWGNSFICDPQGVILAQASEDREEIICAEVDLDHLETIRRNWPFLRDRRIDSYQGILARFIDEK